MIDSQISPQAAAEINQLKNLRSVSFDLRDASDEAYRSISQIRRKVSVNLQQSQRITDAGWRALATAPLDRLMLMQTSVDDAAFEVIGTISSLQSLMVYDAPITDAGLQHLGKLKSLRSLMIRKTKVTNEGVQQLKVVLPNNARVDFQPDAGNVPRPRASPKK